MNTLDEKYIAMLDHVLRHGKTKRDRTGVGTVSVFGYEMRIDLSEGLSLLTTKHVHYPAVIHELLWFLKGGTDIKYLLENKVNIWTDWPLKQYLNTELSSLGEHACFTNPDGTRRHFDRKEYEHAIVNVPGFALEHGRVGKVYGAQWVNWTWPRKYNESIDATEHILRLAQGKDPNDYYIGGYNQVAKLIDALKNNPDSRRMMVNAWNAPEMDDCALPCCHYAFQCYTSVIPTDKRRELAMKQLDVTEITLNKRFLSWLGNSDYMESRENGFYDFLNVPARYISLKFNIRSMDSLLGCPFDVASYSILTHMLAKECNYVPDTLIMSVGDCHIYLNHIDQVKEQMSRAPFENLPKLELAGEVGKSVFDYSYDDFKIVGYEHHAAIKAPIAV